MKAITSAVVMTCFVAATAAAEPATVDLTSAHRTIHPQATIGRVPIEPAFEDYSFMLFDLCRAVGIKCDVLPLMGEINNAVAAIDDWGDPIIVYDRRLSPRLGYIGANAVIAHELGHHYCGHLGTTDLSPHDIEKEADRFMGYSMKRLGASLADLFQTYEKFGIDKGSDTHPPLVERKIAIAEGFFAVSLGELCRFGQ